MLTTRPATLAMIGNSNDTPFDSSKHKIECNLWAHLTRTLHLNPGAVDHESFSAAAFALAPLNFFSGDSFLGC